MNDFNRQLITLARALGTRYTLHSKPITADELFKVDGLFPAIARRADQLCSLCMGYGIGANFSEAENSLLGVQVDFDDECPQVLRFLCIADVLCELVRSSPSKNETPLDELMYD